MPRAQHQRKHSPLPKPLTIPVRPLNHYIKHSYQPL